MKKIHISKEEAAEFYKASPIKPFYSDLCSYLSSGPIVAMILEGKDAYLTKIEELWVQQTLKKLKRILSEDCMESQLIKIQFTVQTLKKMQKKK